MSSPRTLFLLAALAACGPKMPDAGDTGDAETSTGAVPGASSTGAAPGPTTGPVPGDSTTGAPDSTGAGSTASATGDSSDFVAVPDATHDDLCDGFGTFVGVCGEGSKCTIEGGLSNTHCQPVVARPKQRGEPCQALGAGFDGLDDCAEGLFCWDLDAEGQGFCRELCHPGGTCTNPSELCVNLACQSCIVSWCSWICDPLAQDCPAGELCGLGFGAPEQFICQGEAGAPAGAYGDPCERGTDCAPGLGCLADSFAEVGDIQGWVPACAEDPNTGCCTPYCNTDDPDCPDADQGVECLALGVENFKPVGACLVPPK